MFKTLPSGRPYSNSEADQDLRSILSQIIFQENTVINLNPTDEVDMPVGGLRPNAAGHDTADKVHQAPIYSYHDVVSRSDSPKATATQLALILKISLRMVTSRGTSNLISHRSWQSLS